MAQDGKVVGSMVLIDRVRGDAADTVRQLQDQGYCTVMLTGQSLKGILQYIGKASLRAPLKKCHTNASKPLIGNVVMQVSFRPLAK